MKGKIITIAIDEIIDKKLQILQVKIMQEEQVSVGYSKILNDVLRKGLSDWFV